ncbi:MAG TPA: RNA polymerase sigma factor [Solirubrobacteraceae bacterium]|nr:RNA polymerase sigma factor [Solirubrobacteraceae bacterium]
MTRSDADLLRAAGADPSAFRALYERHADAIHGYFERRTRERDAAYDLTAETFARAWESRGRFSDRAEGSAAPWLYGIARNVLLMSVRSRRVERAAADRLGILASGEASVEPQEQWLDGLEELLDQLPQSQRQAVELRVFDDLAYAQVARMLGTSEQGARVRVHRGLAALRRGIERKETT